MLDRLRLINFRCFRDSSLPFRPTTVIVGANNAGKSTIVEALRLLAIIVNRALHLSFNHVPRWLDQPKSFRGVTPSLDNEDFTFENLFHRYGEPPAEISAHFSTGTQVRVFIGGPDRIHGIFVDNTGTVASSSWGVKQLTLGRIAILPQIQPLREMQQLRI